MCKRCDDAQPREKDGEWEILVDGLLGTPGDLDEEHMGLWDNGAFCSFVDSMIFRCEVCEWWCEISEMRAEGDSNGICFECCRDNDIEMEGED